MRRSQDLNVCEMPEEIETALAKKRYHTSVKRMGKTQRTYIEDIITLDTETTNTPDDGFVYCFQMCINGVCVVVRYFEDLMSIFEILMERYHTHTDRRMVVYVHNLGYEHYYLTQLFAHYWGAPDNSLFTKPHKPLTIFFSNGVEFRDSLKLFQSSLAQATKGCPHAKLVGDLDYSKYRTPDTPLTQQEFDYCVNDVIGLYEAIKRFKTEHEFTQATMPYTNTGLVIYTVNNCIRAAKDRKRCVDAMKSLMLSKHQMEIAYNTMAGGDTHGTRWRAGKTYTNCNSYDFKSSHPSRMVNEDFPAGCPMDVADLQEDELARLIDDNYGWNGKMVIYDVSVKPECPDPTISFSKTIATEGDVKLDNGRVLSCDGMVVYMDSNDYQRFVEAYDYSGIMLVEGFFFELKPLPDAFRNSIIPFFEKKEQLPKDSAEYKLSKIIINTIYGACAQKTIRDENLLELGELIEINSRSWKKALEDKDDEDVFKSQAKKFPFLWGSWTASRSRLALFKLIKIIGWDKAIYWDTDSCKYEGAKVPAVDEYNKEIIALCEARNTVVIDRKGRPAYIGVAEDEHPDDEYGYKEFRFLHAKCYAARTAEGIETTIAGVGKAQGAAALEDDINNLRDGLFITDAGGNMLVYNDRPVIHRTDFKRSTISASYIYMQPRQYLLKNGMPTRIEVDESEIIAG